MADEQSTEAPGAPALKDWSKEEKFHLLTGLKRHSSQGIDKIAKKIPLKTTEQIKTAIEYYRGMVPPVRVVPEAPVRKSKKPARVNYHRIPLCSWAEYLQDTFEFKKLETTTPDSIRIIAECEDIPPAKYTSFVNFRKVYHAIADAMEGRPLRQDPTLKCVLEKCMLETALYSKKFNENFYDGLDLSGSPEQTPLPTDTHELTCLKRLTSQKAYNPLNIPVECLKPQPISSSEGSDGDDQSSSSLESD